MSFVKAQLQGPVLNVSLCRPEAHNAMNAEVISDLTKIFLKIPKDKQIALVNLRGEGPSFCAGGDLNWMRQSLKYSFVQNVKDAQKLSNMYEAIHQCPVPVLALTQGNVMGGGVGLTAVCDIVASEPETKFCLSEVKLGLVPSIISPYVLKKIPESAARQLMLTAEIFFGQQAKDIGLVHFVGPKNLCEEWLNDRIKMICANGPEAIRVTKDLIQKVKASSWKAARQVTVKTIAKQRVSKEGQEGMNAFFEKRKPSWRKDV